MRLCRPPERQSPRLRGSGVAQVLAHVSRLRTTRARGARNQGATREKKPPTEARSCPIPANSRKTLADAPSTRKHPRWSEAVTLSKFPGPKWRADLRFRGSPEPLWRAPNFVAAGGTIPGQMGGAPPTYEVEGAPADFAVPAPPDQPGCVLSRRSISADCSARAVRAKPCHYSVETLALTCAPVVAWPQAAPPETGCPRRGDVRDF